MIEDISVEVDVQIDKQTDELVLTSNAFDCKQITRKPIRDFLSLPDGAFVHVDNEWRIHIDEVHGGTVVSDPISEDLRYEK